MSWKNWKNKKNKKKAFAANQERTRIGVEVQGKQYHFNCEGPQKFLTAKPAIVSEFNQKVVMHHIRYDPAITEERDIHELTFNEPEPTEEVMVWQVLRQEEARIDAACNNLWEDIDRNMNISDRFKNEEKAKLNIQHSRDITQSKNKYPELVNRFMVAHERWVDRKQEFDKERGECERIYQKVLGPLARASVKELLELGRYRKVWFRLNTNYNSNIGGTNVSSLVMKRMQNMEFDASTTKLVTVEEEQDKLHEQWTSTGQAAMNDELRLTLLLDTLKKSPGAEYASQINHIQNGSLERAQGMMMLRNRAATLDVEKELTLHDNKQFAGVLQSGSSAGGSAGGGASGGRPFCDTCKRPGHMAAQCKANDECRYCKKKGHYERECRIKQRDEQSKKRAGDRSSKRKRDDVEDGEVSEPEAKQAKVPVPVQSSRFGSNSVSKSSKYSEVFDSEQLSVDFGPEETNNIPIDTEAPGCTSLDLYPYEMNIGSDVRVPDQHINASLWARLLALVGGILENLWRIIIDSGATTHMLPYERMFVEHRSAQGGIYLGDGRHQLSIEGQGRTMMDELETVLYVPSLQVGVISVPKLDESGFATVFANGVGTVYDAEGHVVLTSTLQGNLYYVDEFFVRKLLGQERQVKLVCSVPNSCGIKGAPAPVARTEMSVVSGQGDPDTDTSASATDARTTMTMGAKPAGCEGGAAGEPTSSARSADGGDDRPRSAIRCCVLRSNPGVEDQEGQTGEIVTFDLHNAINTLSTGHGLNPLEILHRMWGHLGTGNIKRALRLRMVEKSPFTYDQVKDLEMRTCFDCLRGRMKAASSNPVTDHPWKALEKVAIDFKGYLSKSKRGFRGMMLMVDYKTNFLYVGLVKDKSEHTKVLEDFRNKIVQPLNMRWKVLQSDSESIFKSRTVEDWLRKYAITAQYSVPYRHWENGQIEVYVGLVMDKARTLMLAYKAPKFLWCYAVEQAVFLINRSPTKDKQISPLEDLYGMKPEIDTWVPFYAPGVYRVSKEERKDPLSPKAEPCRMLGYVLWNYNKSYYVLNVRTGRVLIRAECVFSMEMTQSDLEDTDIDLTEPFETERETVEDFADVEVSDAGSLGGDFDEDEDLGMMAQSSENEVSDESGIPEGYDSDALDCNGQLQHQLWKVGQSDLTAIRSIPEQKHQVDMRPADLDRWFADCVHIIHDVVALPPDPKDMKEALSRPDGELWLQSINKECDQFHSRNIWLEAAQEGPALKTKWVFQYKYDGNYNLVRRARFVICGYSQRKGIDYEDTFAPTTTIPIIFMMFHITGNQQWDLTSFDISAAFLEGKAKSPLYARLPGEMFLDGKAVRVRVDGNWYGRKEACLIWNEHIHGILVHCHFVQCPVMPCLYRYECELGCIFLSIYVDDGLTAASNPELCNVVMQKVLMRVRKAQRYFEVEKFLGMNVTKMNYGSDVYYLDQKLYIDSQFQMEPKVNPKTPMATDVNLRVEEPNPNNESLLSDIGKLRFLADRTRPDIISALGEVSSGGGYQPSDAHVETCQRIIQYVKNNRDLQLVLGGRGPIEMFGYCDATYVTEGKARSRLAGCLFLGLFAGAFLSYSRLDTTVAHSSTETEIKSIDMLIREVLFYRMVCEFFNFPQQKPTIIYVDNKSAIELCRTLKTTHKVRHINMRIQFIRECINNRSIELRFVPGENNVADVLSKALPGAEYLKHIGVLMYGHKGKNMEEMYYLSMGWAELQDDHRAAKDAEGDECYVR